MEANVAAYPGSYEIREALTEFALLPVAEELGLGFTIQELRAYETRLKLERGMARTANTTAASTAIGCLSAAGRSLGRKKKSK